MESQLCKIFVGNVPFQCNQDEFQECFEKMEGYIRAEIVCRPGTNISRGFGFITFNTPKNAKQLIGKEGIIFKDRSLRFTEYTRNNANDCENHNSQNKNLNIFTTDTTIGSSSVRDKNFITVKNLKKNTTREELYDIFSKYGEIGKHFIVSDQETGDVKGYAVVEIIDNSLFDFLIKQKELIIDGSHVLELSKWKTQKCYVSQDKKITKYDLFKAFTAGKNLGMMEAQRSKYNKIATN
jgi:nucleolin